MKTTVSTKGQLMLPAEIRRRARIDAGQEFDVERIGRGEYRLVRRQPPPNEGLIDWLMACPENAISCPLSPNRPTRCDVSGSAVASEPRLAQTSRFKATGRDP